MVVRESSEAVAFGSANEASGESGVRDVYSSLDIGRPKASAPPRQRLPVASRAVATHHLQRGASYAPPAKPPTRP